MSHEVLIRKLLKEKYCIENGEKFFLGDHNSSDTGGLSLTKKQAKKALKKRIKRLIELQELLYATGERILLVAIQGMDTAGKDGTIKHVTSGVNPQGVQIASFKQPGPVEIAHDYLWRVHVALPVKGMIGILNRSHYEEVLVTKVHPENLLHQKIPVTILNDSHFWKNRYDDICNCEKYLHHQGTAIIKIFLNISKEEQRKRLLSRLDRKDKQWKFSVSDPKERQFWDQYQAVYQEAIAQTAKEHAPWIVVPADNKWFARLVVVEAMILELEKFNMVAPQPLPEILSSLDDLKAELGEKPTKAKTKAKITTEPKKAKKKSESK